MLRRLWNLFGDVWLVIIGFILLIWAASMTKADTMLDCVANERAQWAVVGTAVYTGDPWTYSWSIDQEWDDSQGKYVQITPITMALPVPGEQLVAVFSDDSTFTYGEPLTDTNRGVWADRLSSIATYVMDDAPPPYDVSRREDGSIVILKVLADGTCGWGSYLKHPD